MKTPGFHYLQSFSCFPLLRFAARKGRGPLRDSRALRGGKGKTGKRVKRVKTLCFHMEKQEKHEKERQSQVSLFFCVFPFETHMALILFLLFRVFPSSVLLRGRAVGRSGTPGHSGEGGGKQEKRKKSGQANLGHLRTSPATPAGLLGEDDHVEAATPPPNCLKKMSLNAHGGLPSTEGSVAVASGH